MRAYSSPVRPGISPMLTDLYQLTMASAYWKSGTAGKEAIFYLAFRTPPFDSGFTLACGLAAAIDYLRDFEFVSSDLAYLESLAGADDRPLFERAFLDHLASLKFQCDVDAIPEGTVVYPQEPLVRVQGPLLQAQIIETTLLNLINFPSLIATKAARICLAAKGDAVVEFGLRRAQGIDGGLTASRAAYVGGCAATSNVLAGKLFGIPVRGTHTHSWVLSFDNELEAFAAYAKAMPNNCVFLVDTYDSLEGVRHAVQIGRELRKQHHELAGIRLDSGDLAYLSIEARKILDAGGFPKAAILASNDLDEHLIASLKQQGAAISVWGVGTRLATAHEQPALGGVYKLSAIRDPQKGWLPKLKLSEQTAKITNPGKLQVRRFRSEKEFLGDAIFDLNSPVPRAWTIVDPLDSMRRKRFNSKTASEDLLVPIFRHGSLVYDGPSLKDTRARAQQQLAMLHTGIKRPVHPHQYPAGLELGLYNLKTELIRKARAARD